MWQHLEVDMSVLGEEQRKRAALLWPTPLDRKVYAAALVEKVHILPSSAAMYALKNRENTGH